MIYFKKKIKIRIIENKSHIISVKTKKNFKNEDVIIIIHENKEITYDLRENKIYLKINKKDY